MVVYLAYKFVPQEGIVKESIKVFSSKKDAKEYIEKLEKSNKHYGSYEFGFVRKEVK